MLSSGKPIVLTGKVSEMEDRDPEIICERAELIPETAKNISTAKTYKNGLYLKVESLQSGEFESVKKTLSEFHGGMPVYIYCTSNGRKLSAPQSLNISPDSELLRRLSDILGGENVKLIK